MWITADTELCAGAGQCALTAPAVFDQRDEDGTVMLLQPEPPADTHEAVRQAVLLCPTRAIQADE
ncbi:ferredoxin [Saccharopolyspora sp. NPDC003752]